MKTSRRRFIIGFGAMTAALTTRARPQGYITEQTYDLGAQGALYKLRFEAGDIVRCTAAVLPRSSFRATILEQPGRAGSLTAVRDLARKSGARLAINGGRFNGAFAPDGLLIVNGKLIGKKRADWNGALTIDGGGRATISASPDLRAAQYAVQGYPTLVDSNGAMGIKREDRERFRRTVIAQSGDLIIAMVTSAVSLYELAYLLIEFPDAFFVHAIDTALNLSGAATTAFYAKLSDGTEIEEPASWPNRDVIAFFVR